MKAKTVIIIIVGFALSLLAHLELNDMATNGRINLRIREHAYNTSMDINSFLYDHSYEGRGEYEYSMERNRNVAREMYDKKKAVERYEAAAVVAPILILLTSIGIAIYFSRKKQSTSDGIPHPGGNPPLPREIG